VVPWFASAVDEYQRIDALVKAMMVADGLGMIAERGWRPLVNGDFARTYGTRVVVVMHRGGRGCSGVAVGWGAAEHGVVFGRAGCDTCC
jgi:hypothetical protein